MTVTVTVKARAHGAALIIGDEPSINIPANTERQFHVDSSQPLTLSIAEPAEAPTDNADLPLDPTDVPGRAQNDELLGNKPDEEKPTGEPEKPDTAGTRGKRSFDS